MTVRRFDPDDELTWRTFLLTLVTALAGVSVLMHGIWRLTLALDVPGVSFADIFAGVYVVLGIAILYMASEVEW